MRKSLKNKNYARLLGIIGQSKDALSASQIICKLKEVYPSSDWRYVYEMIDELCSSQPFTFARRMFCASDLFSEDSDIRNKCSVSLINKLKKHHQQPPLPRNFEINKDDLKTVYPFFKKDGNNNKTYVEKDTNGKITKVTIEDDHGNSLVIESVSDESIGMTIIYTPRFYPNINRSYNPRLLFPLVLKKKSGKVYAYEAARNLGNPAPLQYLSMEDDGESKKYRLNFRGLVLFLLSENDFTKINAVLVNLSDVDGADIELKRDSNGLSYSINENFPFLSKHFIEFQKAIHGDFVPSRLKEVASEVENKLDYIEMKELQYLFTRKYYTYLENFEFRNGRLFYTRLKIVPPHLVGKHLRTVPNANFDPKPVSIYKLGILYYIRKNIEEDLLLVNEMIRRNEEHLN